MNRRFLFSLFAFSMLCAGCLPWGRDGVGSRPPSIAARLSTSPYTPLKQKIDALIPDTLFPPSNLGVKIVSLSRSQTLYDLNATMLFNPASNEKLVTAATALTVLGDSFAVPTVVRYDSTRNVLIIRGQGDPLLSTGDMDSLAGLIAARIDPTPRSLYPEPYVLAVDVSYFDSLYWGAGWTWDEEPAAYGMFISPLIVNNNAVSVTVRPGVAPGDSVLVTIDPTTRYLSLENSGRTAADTARVPLEISRRWRERSNTITVRGEIALAGKPASDQLSVWQPERYAATLLAERLAARGIPVGAIVLDTAGRTAPALVRYTHLLDTVVTFMNKVSDNLSAEALLKILAAEKAGPPGSAANGISVLNSFLSARGIDTLRISIADGSGLSRYNLISPSTVIRLLESVYREEKHFPAFLHSLPIAGVDGTIRRRMRGTPAEGNLRAKTGTLSAVTALSGYVTTTDGEMLAFSIMMQNFGNASLSSYRAVQDSIGAFLAGMKRKEVE